jgi:hypothetical protein
MPKQTLTIGAPGEPQVQVDEKKSQSTAVDNKPEIPAELEEGMVRGVLKAMGSAGNAIGHDEDVPNQWKFTDAELDGLTPPLTRYINRIPKLREAVVKGDQLTIAMYLGGYLGRNFEDGRKAKKARKKAEDEQQGEASKPANGARAQAGSGGGGSSVDAQAGVASGSGLGGGANR